MEVEGLSTDLQDLLNVMGLNVKKTMLASDLKMKIEQVELLNIQINEMKDEIHTINVQLGLEDEEIQSSSSNTIIL